MYKYIFIHLMAQFPKVRRVHLSYARRLYTDSMGQFNAGFQTTVYKHIIIYEICQYNPFFYNNCNKLQFNTRKKIIILRKH